MGLKWTYVSKNLFWYNITYFSEYYQAVEKIFSGDLTNKMLKIGAPRALLIYYGAFFLLFYLYQDGWSRLVNLLSVNILYLEQMDRVNCLWIVGFALVAYSYLGIMFYENRGGLCYSALKQVLLEKRLDDRLFPSPLFTFFLRRHSVFKTVQLVALISRNAMQLIIIGVSKLKE